MDPLRETILSTIAPPGYSRKIPLHSSALFAVALLSDLPLHRATFAQTRAAER